MANLSKGRSACEIEGKLQKIISIEVIAINNLIFDTSFANYCIVKYVLECISLCSLRSAVPLNPPYQTTPLPPTHPCPSGGGEGRGGKGD
jgi:hypothetical protein